MKVLPSTPDGNCLFNSISILLEGNEIRAKEMRVRCGAFMVKERKKLAEIFSEKNGFNFDREVVGTFREREWAGEPQLLSLAQILKRDILVINAHIDEKAGCPLNFCLINHNMCFLYQAEEPQSTDPLFLLFTVCAPPQMLQKGDSCNHYEPVLKVQGAGTPDISSIRSIITMDEQDNKRRRKESARRNHGGQSESEEVVDLTEKRD